MWVSPAGAQPRNGEASRPVGIDTRFIDIANAAKEAVGRERYDEAIAKVSTALARRPDAKHAALLHAVRAGAYVGKNDLVRAEADAETALRLDPNCADAHFQRGLVSRTKRNNSRAIAAYTRAMELGLRSPQTYNNRGVAYSNAGEHEKALADFNAALRLNPNHVDAYVNRGGDYHVLGQTAKALRDYSEAIRRNPTVQNAHYNRAVLLAEHGEYSKALADLNVAVQRQPRYPAIRVARGRVEENLRLTDRAIADYRAATSLSPPDAEERAARAKAFGRLGQYASAASDFRVARQQLPGSAYVLNASAWFKATCPDAAFRDGSEAIGESRRACELTKWQDGDYIDTLAAAYAESGDFDSAMRYQAEAIRKRRRADGREMEEHLRAYQQRQPYRDQALVRQ